MLAAITLAPPAHADCLSPATVLVPDSGKVPVAARLFLLDAGSSPTVIARAGGKIVPVSVTPLGMTSVVFSAHRLQLDASATGKVEISVTSSGTSVGKWTLEVDATWKAPLVAKQTPTVGRVSTAWLCSYERSVQITFPGSVGAYRVTTAEKEADLGDPKKTTSVYLPRDMRAFFYGATAKGVDLRLGYANCFGDTYTFTTPTVWAEIRALLPDGSEPLVTEKPLLLKKP